RESTHSTMHVVDRRCEPSTRHPREHRVAPPPMKERHRAWEYPPSSAFQPTTLHQLVSGAERRDELWQLEQVVAIVGIADQDVLPARRGYSAHQRAAVALSGDWNNARPG